MAITLLAAPALAAPNRPTGSIRPSGGEVPAPGRAVALVVHNFRYCHQEPCDVVGDQAYVRGFDGPVEGLANPGAFVDVSPGDRVTWTYRDSVACDLFTVPLIDCPGHNMVLEDGTREGGQVVGVLPARSGPRQVGWVVPADARPGSVIRYFCSIRSAWLTQDGWPLGIDVLSVHALYGMTGVFKVVEKA
jgi:hypothetical protein